MNRLPQPIYLDYAATTPLRKEVKERIMELMDGPFGNPSSTHQFGRRSKVIVEAARKSIAGILNCTPKEILFTSGGTEADNSALHLSVRDLGVKRIITSPLEHHAVLNTVELLERKYGVQVDLLRHDECGHPDFDQLRDLLSQKKSTLVSLMHGNNEIGNLLNLQKVGEMCREFEALFHSDTVQTVGHFEIDLSTLPVDFITASAHKFYGPKGVGFLYVNENNKIGSFISGGAQERGHRGGTENIISIGAMQMALEESIAHLAEERNHIKNLKGYFIQKLQNEIGDVRFNGTSGELEDSLYTVLSTTFCDVQDGMLLFNLDLKGIAASGGSACSSGSLKGSHVLQYLYPNDKSPVVRFSFGKDTNKEELDQTIIALQEVLKKKAEKI